MSARSARCAGCGSRSSTTRRATHSSSEWRRGAADAPAVWSKWTIGAAGAGRVWVFVQDEAEDTRQRCACRTAAHRIHCAAPVRNSRGCRKCHSIRSTGATHRLAAPVLHAAWCTIVARRMRSCMASLLDRTSAELQGAHAAQAAAEAQAHSKVRPPEGGRPAYSGLGRTR